MDFRQIKNDAYGIGQRRGMGNAGIGGLGDFSSNYSGGGGYNGGNYGSGGGGSQGGYGGNRNQSPDSGNYNRGGGGGNFDGGPRSNNNYSRSIDDRGFNASINNNQRFGNANDNFQDNFRGQSDNFGSSNRGGGGGSGGLQSNLQRVLALEELRNRNTGGNFNSDMSNNYRGQQGNSDRFFNDSPRNQGNFGGNSGSSYGPNDGPSFGGNNDNFRGPQQSQNFNDQQRSGYNDSYGRGGNFGGQNSGNYGGPDSGNFGGPDSGNFERNFGGQNFNDNFNNRGARGGGGYNNSGNGGGYNNSGNGGGFNNSGSEGNFNAGSERGQGGYNNSGGSGFSNNISRSFNEANSRNWSNQTNQSSSFQSSGYQSSNSGGGGGGGQAVSAWEASQRAYNSKRNQLQKINANNGGAVRKPGPQPAAKAVYNMRNNPNAAAAVTNAAGRNTQSNKAGNVRPGTAAGVQNKAPNQYKLVNTEAVQKKPPVAGQAIKTGPGAVKSGPQAAKKGPAGAATGQQGVKGSPQGVRAGPQGVRPGPQGVRPGPQGVRPGPQGVRPSPQGVRSGPQGVRPGPQGVKGGPMQGVPRGPKAANPAAGPNRPPNAPGIPPKVGQKRVAPAPPLETEPASKSVKKWRRVARKRGFLIGGFKLPYLNDQPKKLPQPESESYALTFFEQIFNYSTNQEAVDEDISEDAVLLNDLSDDESSEEVKVARKAGKKNRKRIRGEWAPLYESKSYKEWDNWWKDYKQFGDKIEKKLVEIGNYNLEHCFIPNLPKMYTEEVVFAIIKSAHFVLEKNADVPYDTMKTIFTLMNRIFLENLTELNILEVEDIIRNIPNDLWVYKLKSMIFLWFKYEAIHRSKSTDEEIVKDQQATMREWKSPAFHWLAKQAFDELVAISESEWKEHRTIFPAPE
ncbi:hypothetical protein KR038_004580 [Drosophila bunnanda]|nr:hypothetical protein KR038_004580 [Drosophila bunnanda]